MAMTTEDWLKELERVIEVPAIGVSELAWRSAVAASTKSKVSFPPRRVIDCLQTMLGE